MRLRLRFWLTALIIAGGTMLGPRANAQQLKLAPIDLQVFRPAMDSKGYITLNSSQVLGQLDFSFGLVSTWGSKVLSLTNPAVTGGGQPARFAINNVITPSLQGAIGLTNFAHFGVEIGVVIPMTILSGRAYPTDPNTNAQLTNDDNEFTITQQGLGDIMLHPKIRLMNAARNSLGLAIIPSVVLPTGDKNAFLGEGQYIFQPSAVVDGEFGYLGRFRVAINAGARIRGKESIFVDDGVTYTAPRTLRGGIKLYLARNSFFLAGGGWRLASGTYGAAAPRAFIGFIFEPNIGDRDGDGIQGRRRQVPRRSRGLRRLRGRGRLPRSRQRQGRHPRRRRQVPERSRRPRTASRTRTAAPTARPTIATATASPTTSTSAPTIPRTRTASRTRTAAPIPTTTRTASSTSTTCARTIPRTRTASRTRTAAPIPTTTRTASSTSTTSARTSPRPTTASRTRTAAPTRARSSCARASSRSSTRSTSRPTRTRSSRSRSRCWTRSRPPSRATRRSS